MLAMVILNISLVSFWWQFPKHPKLSKNYQNIIRYCGTIAIALGSFLSTNFNHDLLTNLASVFGIIATIGVFIGLHINGWKGLLYFGYFNILLVLVNNLMYYNNGRIMYLPITQKITFISFLLWFACIEMNMYKRSIHVQVK